MDRISELPDDVLAIIISCLTLKQAAATSLISTRWRNLWNKHYSSFLDFDGSTIVDGLRSQYMDVFDSLTKDYLDDVSEIRRVNFVAWVNRVLQAHHCATIQRFRVIFDLMDVPDHVINEWIQIAASKNVQCLELDFSCFGTRCLSSTNSYSFLSCSNCHFRSLKTLSLNNVGISKERLESLLDESPNLEELNVTRYSLPTGNLKIYSRSLKRLTIELQNDFELADHNISAPNLLSLTYYSWYSHKSKLVLEYVPKLNYLDIDCYQWCHVQSHLSQLQEILLNKPSDDFVINETELPNLKKFTLKNCKINDASFSSFVAFLQSAPLLENVTIETWYIKLTDAWRNATEGHCYRNLKSVKFVGYEVETDIEIIRFFLSRAPLLEKIIIDTIPQYMMGYNEIYYRESSGNLEIRERTLNCIYKLMHRGSDITRDYNKIVVL
ncbi:hypothetical protein ACFE04_000744 [Oxalis oulophora]